MCHQTQTRKSSSKFSFCNTQLIIVFVAQSCVGEFGAGAVAQWYSIEPSNLQVVSSSRAWRRTLSSSSAFSLCIRFSFKIQIHRNCFLAAFHFLRLQLSGPVREQPALPAENCWYSKINQPDIICLVRQKFAGIKLESNKSGQIRKLSSVGFISIMRKS